MNVRFNYLYRDGGNYKQNSSVVFSNSKGIPIEIVDVSIRTALIDGQWFYANKWKLKDLHLYKWDNEIDHEWHEYDGVEESLDNNVSGDISDFLLLVQN